MKPIQKLAVLAALAAAFGPGGAAAVQRAFVASTGSDTNTATGCVFANPCRSFAAALTQVDPGGEIVALDAAGYGAVAIDRSVTITANPGFYAGIAAASGDAVTITAPGAHVILRGLVLNGIGADRGVNMATGASLTIENCVVSGFGDYGILVQTAAAVRIVDSVVRGNGLVGFGDGIMLRLGARGSLSNVRMSRNARAGLAVDDGADVTTRVAMSDSDSSGNTYGVISMSSFMGAITRLTVARSTLAGNLEGGAFAWDEVGTSLPAIGISASTVSGNGVGLLNQSGLIESLGDNFVRGNGMETSGTIDIVGGL